MNIKSTLTLANKVEMPRLGLGVWKADNETEVVDAVKWAMEAGYQAIDTAAVYKNEEGVGKALKEANIKRPDVFITSKVWNDDQGYEATRAAFDLSLKKLGTDYLDLYLIHWPVAGLYKETWRALEDLYTEGRIRAIGVSNFHEHHLKDLLKDARIKPMVNQIELHPLLNQLPLRSFCEEKGIAVQAWSPLGHGNLLEELSLQAIGKKHGKSAAQVILRWDLQNNILTIPKSVNQHRIKENAAIFDFSLTEAEMQAINELHAGKRFGTNPNSFDQ